jgi:integrase
MGEVIRKVKGSRFIGWYVRYIDADGRRKQRASHQPSHTLARQYLVEIEARIARGQLGIAEPKEPPPKVAELVERFLVEYSRPKIKDLHKYRVSARKNLRVALPLVGKRPADSLTPADIAKLRDTIALKYSPASVRACLAFLATVYSWAVKSGILPVNPVKGVERPVATGSIDFYDRSEVDTLLRVAAERAVAGAPADQLLAACVHLAVHTGLRKGELLGLRWQDLDFTTQRLTVARSYKTTPKSGKPRYLRLPSACVPVLQQWRTSCPASPDGRVFPIHRHSLDAWTPGLLQAAGCHLPAHPWHAMRHTFASHFIMAGGNILTLQKILGHSDVKMTLIYAHLAPDFLGQEMERVRFG